MGVKRYRFYVDAEPYEPLVTASGEFSNWPIAEVEKFYVDGGYPLINRMMVDSHDRPLRNRVMAFFDMYPYTSAYLPQSGMALAVANDEFIVSTVSGIRRIAGTGIVFARNIRELSANAVCMVCYQNGDFRLNEYALPALTLVRSVVINGANYEYGICSDGSGSYEVSQFGPSTFTVRITRWDGSTVDLTASYPPGFDASSYDEFEQNIITSSPYLGWPDVLYIRNSDTNGFALFVIRVTETGVVVYPQYIETPGDTAGRILQEVAYDHRNVRMLANNRLNVIVYKTVPAPAYGSYIYSVKKDVYILSQNGNIAVQELNNKARQPWSEYGFVVFQEGILVQTNGEMFVTAQEKEMFFNSGRGTVEPKMPYRYGQYIVTGIEGYIGPLT